MDFLYSLYDALISINVPGDKARAVVDAMERDMGTTLATKTDLQVLRQELVSASKLELAELRQDLKSEISVVRQELKSEIAGVRPECALIRKDMELLGTSLKSGLTLRLGSMTAVMFGLMFAALKLN